MCTQWNLSNLDTNGAEESVIVSDVSSFQRLKEWYLGWEKVVMCPHFRGREVSSIQECPYRVVLLYVHTLCIIHWVYLLYYIQYLSVGVRS